MVAGDKQQRTGHVVKGENKLLGWWRWRTEKAGKVCMRWIRYADFQAMGYLIGIGAVESANKLVVKARLKGSGMHWARAHVNPMVALRTKSAGGRRPGLRSASA